MAVAGIDTIGGDLLVVGTDLQNLDGLESLKCVGGDIVIRNNENLEQIDALANLQAIHGSLTLDTVLNLGHLPESIR